MGKNLAKEITDYINYSEKGTNIERLFIHILQN